MMAEIGVYALCWALIVALLAVTIPSLGIWLNKPAWQRVIDRCIYAQSVCVACAFLCLAGCFLRNDFTVVYVLANASVALPWYYKLCAVWGGHEGSMLLWIAILSFWMVVVCITSRSLAPEIRIRVLIILAGLSVGFLLFLLVTSNPFSRQFVWLNTQGRDLNPLLQDPGFLFHPPILYMGYVGFAVAFAFAIATLCLGRFEPSWAKWMRPWTLAAWCCLTLGITLGSWWAYRELGWGGWWFWDPVENASLMPWLVGTALLHALMVVDKKTQLLSWTILLAIMAFSLSLVGTFLVRSGVLTSVHAFAVDPLRGAAILLFLTLVIGGSLALFAWRSQTVAQSMQVRPISKESALLLNNVFLVVMMLTVLLGTLYPLCIDGLGLGKLSVGAPYFNTMMVGLAIPFLFLMGLGLNVRWQTDNLWRVLQSLAWNMIISVIAPLCILLRFSNQLRITAYLGLVLSMWVLTTTLMILWRRLTRVPKKPLSGAFCGMLSAHLGVAVTVIGIAISTGYGKESTVIMRPNDHVHLAGFRVQLQSIQTIQGPNYHGIRAQFKVIWHKHQAMVYPEKRIYEVGQIPMSESAIDVTPFRDVYIALGEPFEQNAWSVRMYYKPFVRWIWVGGIAMFLGGLLALFDRRYYRKSGS